MRHKLLVTTILVLLTLFVIPAAAEETYSPEALEIANALNCPVCQGQSVRDSNSALSQQMRDVIQEKLDAGESREQIVDYFTDRYGISILREPPKGGLMVALWWAPVVGLGVGALILVSFIAQRRRQLTRRDEAGVQSIDLQTDPDLARYEERLMQELRGSDQGA